MSDKTLRRLEVFLEFFIFGIIVGIIEDLIAIKLSTGATITWKVFVIVALVALPFAIIGELVVDKIDFIKLFRKR